MSSRETNRKSQNLFHFVIMVENLEMYQITSSKVGNGRKQGLLMGGSINRFTSICNYGFDLNPCNFVFKVLYVQGLWGLRCPGIVCLVIRSILVQEWNQMVYVSTSYFFCLFKLLTAYWKIQNLKLYLF